MQSINLALPILPGKTHAVKNMFKTIKHEKWADYECVQKNQSIEKERDTLQTTPHGDFLLICIESQDIQKTLNAFTSSKDPFDLWYIGEMKKNTGIDFSQPMDNVPESLLSYDKPLL